MSDSKPVIQCRHFNGYKPCGKNNVCSQSCASKDIVQSSILIVHLGALGAVVRATSVITAIKRKFPSSRLTWVTDSPAQHLLQGHPSIDRVLTSSQEDLLVLRALKFDVAFVIDKSLKAIGISQIPKIDKIFGFSCDGISQAILPATDAAKELWEIGLSDHKKFYENKKPETQLLIEALDLGAYQKNDYNLPLTPGEALLVAERKVHWQKVVGPIIGLNTGCSSVIPYKKLTVDFHRRLIKELLLAGIVNIVLLGGPEDSERNQQIGENLPVIQSPTSNGLRDGLVSVSACDLIVTGDSLGMHLGIAAAKYIVAWFGPTCAHEIELYGRGQAILSKAQCSPCWKRVCEKSVMCYDQVDLKEMLAAIAVGLQRSKTHWTSQPQDPFLLSKPHSWEISS